MEELSRNRESLKKLLATTGEGSCLEVIDEIEASLNQGLFDQWKSKRPCDLKFQKSLKLDMKASLQLPTGTALSKNMDLRPVSTTGDGNCLYRACSLALVGCESLHIILRLLTCIELSKNCSVYCGYFKKLSLKFPNLFKSCDAIMPIVASFLAYGTDNEHNKSMEEIIKKEAVLSLENRYWSSFLTVVALANVIQLNVKVIHQSSKSSKEGALFNTSILPERAFNKDDEITLFWCKSGGLSVLTTGRVLDIVNHFVPLMSIQDIPLTTNVWKRRGLAQSSQILPKIPRITHYFKPPVVKSMKDLQCAQTTPGSQVSVSTSTGLIDMVPTSEESSSTTKEQVIKEQQQSAKTVLGEKKNAFAVLSGKSQQMPTDIIICQIYATDQVDKYDIGLHYKTLSSTNGYGKFEVIKNIWSPTESFEYPSDVKFNRKFQRAWLHQFTWLRYSKLYDAAFCVDCAACVGNADSFYKVDALFKSPFRNWKNAQRIFKSHQVSRYHKIAVEDACNFRHVMSGKQVGIDRKLDSAAHELITKNRKVIECLTKILVTMARQNIALRGHRDDATLTDIEDYSGNPGNFKAIVDLCVELGCPELKEHFQSAPKNATYTSKTIQNELLKLCAENVLSQLINDIKLNKFFSVLADEATDISNIEQMPLVIRYVNDCHIIREVMVKMVRCVGLDGKSLSNTISQEVQEVGLSMDACRGQGYDGAGAMAGSCNGAAALISRQFPKAIYMHCASHKLNLCVASSCKATLITNMMDNIRCISDYFNNSTIRSAVLAAAIHERLPNASKEKLHNVCKTRWVLRLDGLDLFVSYYPAITQALEQIKDNIRRKYNNDSVKMATSLFYVCTSFEFISVLVIVQMILSHSRPLTVKLQKRDQELLEAYNEAAALCEILLQLRSRFDEKYDEIFKQINELAECVGTVAKMPRTCGKQQHRENYHVRSAKEYYKVAVGLPFLDHLLEELKRRFSPETLPIYLGFSIVPSNVIQSNNWQVNFLKFVNAYQDDITNLGNLHAELFRWEIDWVGNQLELPDNILKTLRATDKDIYPTIYQCLRIMATVPVTTCECERKISGLRRLKTWLRSTMSQERLNSLAVIMENRDIKVNIQQVIDKFASDNKRRMLLKNIFCDI